jgi:hypothetical protein
MLHTLAVADAGAPLIARNLATGAVDVDVRAARRADGPRHCTWRQCAPRTTPCARCWRAASA